VGCRRRSASLDQVLPRAQALAESLAAKPQLLTRYLAVTVRAVLTWVLTVPEREDLRSQIPGTSRPAGDTRSAVMTGFIGIRRPAAACR
jgi:hypothetical protein